MENLDFAWDESWASLFGIGAGTVDTHEIEKQDILSSAQDYLSREERITSLAKEHYEKAMGRSKFTDVEEKLFSLQLQPGDITKTIAKSVVRPLLRSVAESGDYYCRILEEMAPEGISVRLEKNPNASRGGVYAQVEDVRECIRLKSTDALFLAAIKEEGYAPMYIYGAATAHPKRKRNVLIGTAGICVADIGELFSTFLILKVLEGELSRIKRLTAEERMEDVVYRCFTMRNANYPAHRIAVYRDGRISSEALHILEENADQVICYHGIYTSKNSILDETCREAGVAKQDVDVYAERHSYAEKAPHMVYARYFTSCGHFVYHDLLDMCIDYEGTYWALPVGAYWLQSYFYDAWETYHSFSGQRDYWKNVADGYAKSFQTRRNIPKKVLDAMESSILNTYFGFVEYDEECDLGKVAEIEKEIVAFIGTWTPFVHSGNNAIRFRKLGNHKASGLYYPFVKCLCVDMRNTDSFVHEYGHLIDYEYGCLSEKFSFQRIIKVYGGCLSRNEGIRNRKSKYCLSYYMTPTEVFARAFEVYVRMHLGVHNSLLPEEFGEAYPVWDEAYLSAVREYFDQFFLEKKEEPDETN